MNDEQFFLANAYLDGELTAEERTIAEADPVVMAAVAALRDLQDQVRHVAPPSTATRETAITAAMSQFEVAIPPANDRVDDRRERRSEAPVPFRPRPSYARYLAVAAGVLGVGLLGVAIANLDTGDGDDASDSAAEEPAAEEPAAEEPAADDRATDAGGFAAESADAPTEMIVEAPADEPASEPAMDAAEEPAEGEAEESAEAPAEEPASEPVGEAPTLVPGQVLTTPAEVGAFGTELLEQERVGTLPPTPNHACPIDGVLGRAEYQAEGTATSILVAVDEPAGVVLGFDEETCELLVDGPLYLP